MSGAKFRVAICGGGVGGLTLALCLSKHPNISVSIYEAAHDFTPVGAGIGIFLRSLKIIHALGIGEEFADLVRVPGEDPSSLLFHYRKSDQAKGVSFYDLDVPGGLVRVHRADLQRLLLAHVPKTCPAHTSKRLVSYSYIQPSSSSSPIVLTFADGTSAYCDVLIGADGVRSTVRAGLVRDLRANGVDMAEGLDEPEWSGQVAYRALIPVEKVKSVDERHQALNMPMQYLGKDGFVICYPVSRGKVINFVAFTVQPELEGTNFDGPLMSQIDSNSQNGQSYKRQFYGWEREVETLLQCAENPLKSPIHVQKPLPSWVSGRVAILGDAAHAMGPYQGAGGGQAIEDAYLLSTLLGHPLTTLHTLPLALQIYEQVRRPFAEEVVRLSRENGLLCAMQRHDFTGSESEDSEKLTDLSDRLTKNWDWAWTSEVDGDMRTAVGLLEKALGMPVQ